MAIDHQTYSVGTSPILIADAKDGVNKVMVYVFNNDASSNIWVGDASVVTAGSSAGFKILKDSGYTFEIYGGEILYAISTTTTSVSVMTTGN